MGIDDLLNEISPDAPCGEDLSYDPLFLELETAARGKQETQFSEAEPPDWRNVRGKSLELLERSRDLRLITYLAAARLELEGLEGFCESLELLKESLSRYWDSVFPQLDPDDDNDPLERVNIIASLSPSTTGMADQDPLRFRARLLNAPLCSPEDKRLHPVSLRHILINSGEMSPPDDTGVPDTTLVEAAFDGTPIEDVQQVANVLEQCIAHVSAIDTFLTTTVGAGSAPDLGDLTRTLKQASSAVATQVERRGYGNGVASPAVGAEPASGDGAAAAPAAAPGRIGSKQDVLKALDRICEYYNAHEPSSPVPLLLKRAKRLVGMSFIDIIRDITPDAVSQVRVVSGEKEEEDED